MAKYVEREALVEWLKRIPLKDLSDGLGLCRVIMEDDFKKAIKNMPKGIIVDAVPVSKLEELRDYLYSEDLIFMRGLAELNKLIANYSVRIDTPSNLAELEDAERNRRIKSPLKKGATGQ